jgi:formylmethanofuran dehydrogenase subunit C
MITLQPLKEFVLPVTADCISPDVFQHKTRKEMETLLIWEGNKQRELSDLFKVEGAQSERAVITINGDVSHVRQIGKGMTGGEIAVNGNVGMHLGEDMKEGKIVVHGSVGGWAGSMMRGGVIEVYGDAGDYLGAPPRGSTQGMHGGRIVVHRNVGNEAGAHMKRGLIRVFGNAGQFTGFRMRDGMVYVQGDCEGRAGACMVGGKVVVNGLIESILPTFTIDSMKPQVKVDEDESVQGPFYVFLGDLAENGNGKLYVSKEKNPHFGQFEKLL